MFTEMSAIFIVDGTCSMHVIKIIDSCENFEIDSIPFLYFRLYLCMQQHVYAQALPLTASKWLHKVEKKRNQINAKLSRQCWIPNFVFNKCPRKACISKISAVTDFRAVGMSCVGSPGFKWSYVLNTFTNLDRRGCRLAH